MAVSLLDRCDRRVLGAIRLLDNVTGETIRHPMAIIPIDPSNPSRPVVQPELDIRQNRRGYYVLFNAPGLTAYRSAFLPFPPEPSPGSEPIAIGSITIPVVITDPTGYYLPRQFILTLPRDPALSPVDPNLSLFEPIDIPLYRSPKASVEPNWSVIRATVVTQAEQGGTMTTVRLPWARIQLTQQDDSTPSNGTLSPRAVSLADWRGEALIAIPGVPVVMSNGGDRIHGSEDDNEDGSNGGDGEEVPTVDEPAVPDGPVVVREVTVQLQVSIDPTLTTIPQDADLLSLGNPNRGYVPNLDAFTTASDPLSYDLRAGRDRPDTLVFTFP